MSPKRGPGFVPKLSHYLRTEQGRVRIPGKGDIYLGESGCWPADRKKPPAEVVEAYQREIARWTAARAEGRSEEVGPGCTITQVCVAYMKHCQTWYRKRGKPTSQVDLIARAVREVRRLFGSTPAADFGWRDLRTIRDQFERMGTMNRDTINAHVGRIRKMFRWAVDEEFVPEDTWLRLKAVAGLQRGRTTAREAGKVPPVAMEIVAATLPHLPPVVQAMVQIQALCGMRPEEVCFMRAGDVTECEDGVWRYVARDDANKLAHKGIDKTVYLGPRAQAILQPWLEAARTDGPDEWVFPKRLGLGPMTPENYLMILTRTCERAGIPHWSPGQLRHTAATDIRQLYGIEAVQAMLGHSDVTTSQIYALKSEELAKKIARERG